MGRLTLVLLLAVVVLGAGVYVTFRHVPTILGETGCTAGTGHVAVTLDPQQAQIAATIAGVAHHRGMWSLGLLLTLGSVTSLVASIVVLPVLMRLLDPAPEAGGRV